MGIHSNRQIYRLNGPFESGSTCFYNDLGLRSGLQQKATFTHARV